MNAEDLAILVILVLALGFIGMLAMPMFDKIPRSDDPITNGTVNTVSVPMTNAAAKGFTAFDIGLIIAAIIGAIILLYTQVYKQ